MAGQMKKSCLNRTWIVERIIAYGHVVAG